MGRASQVQSRQGTMDGPMRPESEAMKFGDDWRGVFIRGDNAFGYAMDLRHVLDTCEIDTLTKIGLKNLLELLASSDERVEKASVQIMKPFAECFVRRDGERRPATTLRRPILRLHALRNRVFQLREADSVSVHGSVAQLVEQKKRRAT